MTPAFYNILADLTVALHALFVLFVAGGQVAILAGWLRKWHWVRSLTFRLLHCAAILFVVISTWLGMICPLTTLENYLRRLAGTGVYEMSFIGYWLNRLLFYTAPDWAFTAVYTAFGFVVLITYIACPPLRKSR